MATLTVYNGNNNFTKKIKMKKISTLTKISFLIIVAGILSITSINAQSVNRDSLKNATPEQRAQMQSDMMKNKLVLTDEQYKQVSDINLKYARKMDDLKQNGGGKFSKARKAKSIMSDKDDELQKVFTKEQFEKYETLKKEMMDKARDAYKNRDDS